MVKKLSPEDFSASFQLVPRIALNLFIKTHSGKFLLTKRAKLPFVDYWHIPGSFLLKNEKMADCLVRIAKHELGIDLDLKKFRLLGAFENLNDPRGHVLDIIYEYNIEKEVELKPINETKEIKWFNQIPSKIGFNHKDYLRELIKREHEDE